jgi:betaine-aldehyde dehydrogenase
VARSYRREPLGVVLGITPWNFPLWQAVWKIGPALAAGNTVVIKPAELTPMATTRFAELAQDILPPGVLNVVHGSGGVIGDALVRHPEVDLVSFTGSTAAGRAIAAAACGAPKQEALGASLAATRVGDAADPNTVLGPLISRTQRDRVAALVNGRPEGSKIVTGGNVVEGPGFFFEPTLITGLRQDDDLVQQEIFGPVATVQTFTDEADALAKANAVEQGLAASVWTRDIGRALRNVNALNAGIVWVNNHMAVGPEGPLGGFKGSGYGKEGGSAGLEEFTRVKQVVLSLS